MGYESIERDSLITLRFALALALRSFNPEDQNYKDINYELQRINVMLIE